MAKKVRKPRSQNPRTYAEVRTADDTQAWTSPSASSAKASSRPVPAAAAKGKVSVPSVDVDWERQYGYVFKDLRRTFILAGGLLILLIGLNILISLR